MVRRSEGPTKREIHRASRRQEILDAAMRLVADEGIGALTMPRLASEVDAAVGALYRYFDSKDALMGALQLQAAAACAAFMEDRLATPLPEGTPPRVVALVRVIRTFDTWLAYAEYDAVRFRLIDAVMSAPQALLPERGQRAVQEVVEPILRRAGSELIAATVAGALQPGDDAVRTIVLWGAFHGLGHFRRHLWIQVDALRVPRLVRTQWRAVLIGWGGDPALVDRALDLAESLPLVGPAASEEVVDVDVDAG